MDGGIAQDIFKMGIKSYVLEFTPVRRFHGFIRIAQGSKNPELVKIADEILAPCSASYDRDLSHR